MPVTFQDKDNTLPTSDPRKLIRAMDVNELKQVINATEAVANAVDASLDAVLASAPSEYNTFLEVGNKLTSLDTLKAPIDSPTFTGTVSGITKSMVGLSNVDNTADTGKPVSTAQQTALDLKLTKTDDVWGEVPTGTVNGINDTFTIANANPSKKALYLDGIRTNPSNFSISGTTLTVTNAGVIPTNSILIDYVK